MAGFLKEYEEYFSRKEKNKAKLGLFDVQQFKKRYLNEKLQTISIINEITLNRRKEGYAYTFKDLTDVNFPMMEFTNFELLGFINVIINELGYLKEFNIDESTFKNLIYEIALNYNIVPYHTFTHAFSIFHVNQS